MIATFDAVTAVIRRPSLWATAARQLRRTVPRGWWRHRPYLPVPDAEYTRFRMLTQYGDGAHRADADDVVNYLTWCKRWHGHDPRRRPAMPGQARRR